MKIRRFRAERTLVAGLYLLSAVSAAQEQPFDSEHTRVGFALNTRWGQQLQGEFPRHEGAVQTLPDGRQRVRMQLETAQVRILGYPRYTEISRGPDFFDVARYPSASFTSDPYGPELLVQGGKLGGTLRLHGVGQHETFTVEPAHCTQPAVACDLIVRGSVRREDYGMDDWKLAIRGRVSFELRLRLQPQATQ